MISPVCIHALVLIFKRHKIIFTYQLYSHIFKKHLSTYTTYNPVFIMYLSYLTILTSVNSTAVLNNTF